MALTQARPCAPHLVRVQECARCGDPASTWEAFDRGLFSIRTVEEYDAVIARFVDACIGDGRIVAAFLGGSIARGEADEYSDLDLGLIVADSAYDDVLAERANFIRKLGDPLFLEDFGHEGIAFFILPDGIEGELCFGRDGELGEFLEGPYRVLVDKKGLLAGAGFAQPKPDAAVQAEELRRVLYWFWHELSHFIAALGRGHLWWAAGQLEALRGHCVNLARIEQNVEIQEEPYEKLDQAISTNELVALQSTFPPMKRGPMLRALLNILAFYRERAPRVAREHGLTYPAELERLMCSRLDVLARSPQ
jgi:predicted nucleotidyltransferase